MEVEEGALFGLLGPNGAGKTTTMRMILDLFRPDSGEITWNGQPVSEVPPHTWGYLPEERGLYPKMEVEEHLLFLARLNGLSRQEAARRLDEWLERFRLGASRENRVEELSRGNQQKVQFLAAILHDPAVLIMDEPFSGLDPVNTNFLKEALLELHHRGKTIIFSTHQLDQVEELCRDVVIIDRGRSVLQGSVHEIRRRHGRSQARLKLDNDPEARWLETVPGVQVTERRQDYIKLHLQKDLDPNLIVAEALHHGATISRFEVIEPSLTDIFIGLVGASASPELESVSAASEREE